MLRNDEDFFSAAERQQEPLNTKDRQWLRDILSSPPFLKAAKEILNQTDELKNNFLRFNLGDEKERAAASRLQGQVAAYPQVFSLLVNEALKKEEPQDETRVEENNPSGA